MASRIYLTPALARAAGTDAGNRSMRAAGRTVWNEQDLEAAVRETNRLLDQCDSPAQCPICQGSAPFIPHTHAGVLR